MTTTEHALNYLRQAEYIAGRDGLTPAEAMARVGAEVKQPCRAIGTAKRAIKSYEDFPRAIDALERLWVAESNI